MNNGAVKNEAALHLLICKNLKGIVKLKKKNPSVEYIVLWFMYNIYQSMYGIIPCE